MALADVDLLDLDRWARDGAPHAWFHELRREAPAWRHPSPDGGRGFWVITGYDDVVALGRCPHVLSSDQDNGGVTGLGPGDELQAVFDKTLADLNVGGRAASDAAKHLLTLDPPEHTAYRKIVNKGFTPRMIGLLEGRVSELLDDLLDRHARGEAFDLVPNVSMPLPIHVIAEMIGAHPDDHGDLVRWSNEAIASTDPEYSSGPGSQLNAVMHLVQYFSGLRAEHEAHPAGDLITTLLDAEVDGEALTNARFMLFLILLTAAGNETTRTAISHCVLELARHPEQWHRLKDDPGLIPAAVEELLRYASPVMYFRRNALEAMELAGSSVEPGDIVTLWYIAANRDEAQFDAPDHFDVGRTPNPQIAFGGGGPHFCLGASLARLEVRVLLEALVERYDSIELAGPFERVRSNFIQGIKHLPVVLS
ncbi:MAG: cytochrome P450 [Acidimicrobiales bacterium]